MPIFSFILNVYMNVILNRSVVWHINFQKNDIYFLLPSLIYLIDFNNGIVVVVVSIMH